jgi:Putative DNA-binding domain
MPTLPADVTELFSFDEDTGAVTSRESKRLEFKEDFSAADMSDYTKVLASLANTHGGTIVFGVSNRPKHVVGATNMVDEANWVNALRADFDPEISIAIREYKIHGLTVYAVSVDEAVHKPVICKKSRSKLVADKNGKQKDVMIVQESAVYYRYAGQTKTIGYADFQHMLAEREAAYLRKMMETLQVVQKVGVANAGVMDMSGPKSSVYMSKETAKGLNLIDKANLVEKKGAPAYVVMGNVDVNQIVHAPLEDADKNIPTEAAKLLSPIIAEVYGEDVQVIHASQVTALLKHLGIDGDNLHCIFEKKFGRKFVTRAGLQALETFIREHPEQAINVFGSKAAKQRFSITNLREKAASERSNT